MYRSRKRGQSAILVALALPFLMAFTLMVVEVAERWLEVAMVEDALQQATRSTVQRLDYADLAQNRGELAATRECRQVSWSQDSACRPLLSEARRLLLINLGAVRGLAESPEGLADRVRWTVLPRGATASFAPASLTLVRQRPCSAPKSRPACAALSAGASSRRGSSPPRRLIRLGGRSVERTGLRTENRA
ncbi:hypothetical protein HC891_20665 [Candidatus Gracilibacteria bacterium]|nr:hypothetical protein [Candidatus Gracilibacteria bacterium]